MKIKLNLIAHEPLPNQPGGVGTTCFMGVCGPDSHIQAPMDGFMASLETGGPSPGLMTKQCI